METSDNLAVGTHVRLSRFEYLVVRVGVSKTEPPPVSKVKLPLAAGAVKNHVLNVFESGRYCRRPVAGEYQ